jgi:hypothetical protein
MRLPATVKWISLALLGLVIAAAVALAASNLAGQQIGIASESISAGDALAPAIGTTTGGRGSGNSGQESTAPTTTPGGQTTTPTTTQPPAVVPTEPTEPSEPRDEHSGSGGHEASDD